MDDCRDQETLDRVAAVRARLAKFFGDEPQRAAPPPKS
jgi:hypothetical protein